MFLVCVSDLAIECRDYDLLFGKLQPNRVRSAGLIDQFESIDVDPRKACEMVAEELVKKGLFEDAIKLFDLAGVSKFIEYIPEEVYNIISYVKTFYFGRLKISAYAIYPSYYRKSCINLIRKDPYVNVFIIKLLKYLIAMLVLIHNVMPKFELRLRH